MPPSCPVLQPTAAAAPLSSPHRPKHYLLKTCRSQCDSHLCCSESFALNTTSLNAKRQLEKQPAAGWQGRTWS
jgi:hypothetical protein